VQADPAEILRVDADLGGETWRFAVTLVHGDTGWDDYADGWRVELSDGTVLATRVLFHPHVDEQPFTRSQSGVRVPPSKQTVFVRASTNADGWADDAIRVELPR